MVTKIDDAVIEVRIETDRARSVIKNLEERQKKIQVNRREERREVEDQQRRRRELQERLQSRFGVRDIVDLERSAFRLALGAAEAVPILGPLAATGVRAAEMLESSGGASFLRGVVGRIADEVGLEGPLRRAVQDAVSAPDSALAATVGALKARLRATQQTATEGVKLGKAVSLLGIDISADAISQFLGASYQFNIAVERGQRIGRRESNRMLGDGLARIATRGLAKQ